MERICVYPGSFDPVTVGHVDIIRRAAALFDRMIVAVLHNPGKKGTFSVEERLTMLRRACDGIPGVTCDAFSGLLVDYVRKTGACAVVRGLRAISDYETEKNMAVINSQLLPGMETVFLLSKPEHGCVSSSAVRELASFGGDFRAFVPEANIEDILRHYQ